MSSEHGIKIVELIKLTSAQIRANIESVGSHAKYLWLDSGKFVFCNGYSYELPKEEQIRSSFFSAIQSSGDIFCEVEWNIYEPGLHKTVRVAGEIDIVGYPAKSHTLSPLFLIEIKRAWCLKGWKYAPSEMVTKIQGDINKLQPVYDEIRKLSTKDNSDMIAGVLIVYFSDSLNDLRKLTIDISNNLSGIREINNLWVDTSTPCFQFDRELGNQIPIFTSADLAILK